MRTSSARKQPALRHKAHFLRRPGTHDDESSSDAVQNSLETAQLALAAALAKKALEPVLLDMREMCSYTDYLLIVSGRSDRQVDAISEGIRDSLKTRAPALGVEGLGSGHWALLDYGDVVVHVFYHPARLRYDLEGLWVDVPRVSLDVPKEARANPGDLYERQDS